MERMSDYLVAAGRLKAPKPPLDYTYTDPVAAVDPALVKVAGTLPALTMAGRPDRRGADRRGLHRRTTTSPGSRRPAGADAARRRRARVDARARTSRDRFGVPDATDDVDAALARARRRRGRRRDAGRHARGDRARGRARRQGDPAAEADGGQRRRPAGASSTWRARTACDLQVSFMHRFFDEVVEARRLLREGAIGRVLSARLRNATPGPDWGDWFFRADDVSRRRRVAARRARHRPRRAPARPHPHGRARERAPPARCAGSPDGRDRARSRTPTRAAPPTNWTMARWSRTRCR